MRPICLLLLSVATFAADPRISALIQVTGIDIGAIKLDGGGKTTALAQVTFSNLSSRSIVAYYYTIQVRFSDGRGQTLHATSDDTLFSIVAAAVQGGGLPDESLHRGEFKTVEVPISCPTGTPPVSVNAAVTAVALDDVRL